MEDYTPSMPAGVDTAPGAPPGPEPVEYDHRYARAAAALAAVGAATALQGCPTGPGFAPGDPYPDVVPPLLSPELRRLVERATFGWNAREAELAQSLGHNGYIAYHLDHESIDDRDVDAKLATLTTLQMTTGELVALARNGDDSIVAEFIEATLFRAAYSRRQLFERMVEFWTYHFNIHLLDEYQIFLKPPDDREVIRPHALGNFAGLLQATAESPAMLLYLDNAYSYVGAPNENYARELLELHTLGEGNYTQHDVDEVARCFTGWTVTDENSPEGLGKFVFRADLHDTGRKEVFGHVIPEGGGKEDGDRVLQLLTADPEVSSLTAQFLGRKLAVQFWGYDPPQQLIDSIAGAYRRTGGDIKEMVRAALDARWLGQAPPKLKRPMHYVISSLRARPSNIDHVVVVRQVLASMGNHPYLWPAPDGYPDDANHWAGLVLYRWGWGAEMARQPRYATLDLAPLLVAQPLDDFLDALDAYFFGGTMPPDHRAALANFLADAPNNINLRRQAVGLVIGSAEFQWY